jgi:hypothetical protein
MILTPDEVLLEEAKTRFPAGTHFVSLFGSTDYVKRTPVTNGKLGEPSYFLQNGEVFVMGYAAKRLIYTPTLGWAGTI